MATWRSPAGPSCTWGCRCAPDRRWSREKQMASAVIKVGLGFSEGLLISGMLFVLVVIKAKVCFVV